MKFILSLFAALAIVPQALRGMVWVMATMNKCTLPAQKCEFGGNDQSAILNMIWGPNFYTTTGLYIGGAGLVVTLVIMKILMVIDDKKSQRTIGRGVNDANDAQSGEKYGRAPRPPAFDKYGRPRGD